MDITIATTFLPHSDPEASLVFYRDVLGFEVRNDVGQGTMRWITVAPAGSETAIVLHPPVADPDISDEERRVITGLMAKGSYAMLVFSTPDLQGAFAKIEAGGAEVIQEPTDQDWGARDCAVRDPAGNTLRLQQA